MTSVSVVIPTNRFDAWLNEAVESALASRDVDLEVVVVANGLARISDRPWRADARVNVVHVPAALGPTGAMILGVDRSAGKFIARLDADDRMHPSRLSQQLAYLRAHPEVPLIGTTARRISSDGAPAGAVRMPTGADVRPHLVLSNTVPHSSVMMRRDALDRVGGYNPRLAQMEDYDLILRLGLLGPIPVLAEPLIEYRLHRGQTSRGAKPRGEHIDRVLQGRRELGRVLGMGGLAIEGRNLIWRAVQYTRYFRITRPGHEY